MAADNRENGAEWTRCYQADDDECGRDPGDRHRTQGRARRREQNVR